MRRVLPLVMIGCSYQPGATVGGGGGDGAVKLDARSIDGKTLDAPSDCYGAGAVIVCLTTAPTQPLVLPGGTNPFDTGATGACTQIVGQTNGPSLCVLAGTTVTVNGTFYAIGSMPLVLVGATAVNVTGTGTVDVSSTFSPRRKGAGANATSCAPPAAGASDRGGGGGGAGGSFGTVGGTGGTGDLNSNGPPLGVARGGVAAAVDVPHHLRGGCPGGTGGDGDDPTIDPGRNPGGAGGDSGGAVYLMAGTSITIDGNVFASGSGGGTIAGQSGTGNCVPGNGGFEQGGGGAGTGGMIGLAAPTISISGRVAANGGGGGGGGGCLGGTPGGDGTTTMWNAQAAAGAGDAPGEGANGGLGTALGVTTGVAGVAANAGGGGGGGGLGVVWIDGTVQGGAMVSPAPSAH